MSLAIKKILYAVDAKVSALGEAQEILTKSEEDAGGPDIIDDWSGQTVGISSPWSRQCEIVAPTEVTQWL